jgi:carboxyl-terminal processing protease
MSIRSRDVLTVAMVLLLALSAFAAGFLVHDILAARTGRAYAEVQTEEFSIFWEAWGRVEQSFIGELPSPTQVAYGAIRGAITELNDSYTIFVEPPAREQERDSLRGNFGGVGANLQRTEAGDLILLPIPGNPAEAAGILDNDILLAVDGQEITPEMTLDAIVLLVRGEEGTKVTLTVLHTGADRPVDITVTRAIILLPSVTFRVLAEDATIGYIQLTRFSGESGREVREALESLQEQGVEKLILDLRHNGGGLLDAAVEVSDHFLDEGPVLYQISRSDEEKTFLSTGDTLASDMLLVVLVDEATASASEIVAGALQDRNRAVLIGRTTFGKGSVQLVYDLSDGSSIHVTSARWYTPDRQQIDGQGIEPDILVELSPEDVAAGQDFDLAQAVSYLQSQGS